MKFNLKFLFITLFICTISIAQNKGTISGVLTDKESNNQPLPFANVLLKGTNISANTDMDGKYSLNANPGNYIVIFSFVGYENVETPVTVKANETVTKMYNFSSVHNLNFPTMRLDVIPMVEIIKAVSQGAQNVGKKLGENLFEILDRREAIKKAVAMAQKGDLILVTGKGSEQKMCVAGGKMIEWDDRQIVKSALKKVR